MNIIKKDFIDICCVSPAHFWANFSLPSLSNNEFFSICSKAKKYIKEACPLPYLNKKVFFYR